MKKLLILMLVLGMTATVNAALSSIDISVNGATDVTEMTLEASETAVIDVHVLAQEQGIGYLVITWPSDPDGEWYDDLGANVPGQWETSYPTYPNVYAGAGNFPGSTIRWSHAAVGFGYEFTVAGSAAAPQLPGGLAFDYLFHCEEADSTVVIQAWDEDQHLMDTLTIHQVPEPMTIMLLGLGGLLLRRRK